MEKINIISINVEFKMRWGLMEKRIFRSNQRYLKKIERQIGYLITDIIERECVCVCVCEQKNTGF